MSEVLTETVPVQVEQENIETPETVKGEQVEKISTNEEKTEPEQVQPEQTEPEQTEPTEVKPEQTEPTEEPTKDEPEDEVNVDELLEDVKDKDVQLTTLKDQVKKEQGKVDKLKEQVKSLETVVSGLVETKLKDLPEGLQALVPEGDSVSKLAWLSKAEESGIFNKQTKAPNVEIGKPMALGNPTEKAESNLTGQQKLSNYFSNYFKR